MKPGQLIVSFAAIRSLSKSKVQGTRQLTPQVELKCENGLLSGMPDKRVLAVRLQMPDLMRRRLHSQSIAVSEIAAMLVAYASALFVFARHSLRFNSVFQFSYGLRVPHSSSTGSNLNTDMAHARVETFGYVNRFGFMPLAPRSPSKALTHTEAHLRRAPLHHRTQGPEAAPSPYGKE